MVEHNTPPAAAGADDGSKEEASGRKTLLVVGRIAAVLVSVGITLAVFLLRDRLQELAVYGYPGVFLVSLIGNATIILPAPTYVVAFAAGVVLNPVLVGILAGAGASLGELTGYLAGVGGQAVVENRPLYERIEGWMRKRGMLVIFGLAAVPNPFFDIGGLVAGALRMPVWKFLAAAWAGKTIRFTVLAFLGAGLEQLLTSLLPSVILG